jgi:hypothetical protein
MAIGVKDCNSSLSATSVNKTKLCLELCGFPSTKRTAIDLEINHENGEMT